LSLENARRGITNRHWNPRTGDQELRLEIDGD
jgi:hypothetical protein